ncbi:hypothetical protein THIX_10308 [Thiomonas sp. X19]|nr:hypothetical protein THIX_10308 [Thiomonas sp. X19]
MFVELQNPTLWHIDAVSGGGTHSINPEERPNADLKQVMRKKVPVRTKARLQKATETHMHVIAREPERVKAYFQDPYVRYAA